MDAISGQSDGSRTSGLNPVQMRKGPSRKSRSKGLRTKTGCITCRKRHKKCNEVSPICGNCAASSRSCVWPDLQSPFDSGTDQVLLSKTDSMGHADARDNLHRGVTSPLSDRHTQYIPPEEISQTISQLQSPYTSHISPSNTISSEFLTPDLASVRWLDLLATDALQANRGFTRPCTPVYDQTPANSFDTQENITQQGSPSFNERSKISAASEGLSWQLDRDIVLKNSEIPIFRNFVDHIALWLDLFDPEKHFSIYTTRLALRNIGLMKAILALSSQHLSRQEPKNGLDSRTDPSLAIQYYYETLHYVQTALHHTSYANSEQLLATVLIISTYEMLDQSESAWQRHLKGVFWIQRSQDVDGASGGIRQAVWWAWLRQDVWAAFKEKRRCLSFWVPVKDYPELNKHQLVDRVTYLFSQAVNYCAKPQPLAAAISQQDRIDAGDQLLAKLDRWKSFLGEEFKPLPVANTRRVFQPLWIHPQQLGVALQLFYFARILIILHRSAVSGFHSYLKVQKSLSEAVGIICGIAMELTEEGCQIISSQCLYGAGLCVQEIAQRNEIISLISACEARTGWPMSTLREDLYKEWEKCDSDDRDEDVQTAPQI